MEELQQKIDELIKENHKLHEQLSEQQSLLVMGSEKELYPGEIKDIILTALSESISLNQGRSRRTDVIQDIITSNHYEMLGKSRITTLKKTLKNYKGMDKRTRKTLEELGFRFKTQHKHLVATYYGDARYRVLFSSTPSDSRCGMNLATNAIRVCL